MSNLYFLLKLRHKYQKVMNFDRKTEQFCEKKTQKFSKKLSLPEALTPKSSKILVKKKACIRHHMAFADGVPYGDNSGVSSICLFCMHPTQRLEAKCSSQMSYQGNRGRWYAAQGDPKITALIEGLPGRNFYGRSCEETSYWK